ncbi:MULTISPECIES: hypothetical protein, partial [Ruegeria]|uniref:hypothetical protein n=2 Tax=Roseobacteraceae TaxID=2854170 RepID=UPI001C10F199
LSPPFPKHNGGPVQLGRLKRSPHEHRLKYREDIATKNCSLSQRRYRFSAPKSIISMDYRPMMH